MLLDEYHGIKGLLEGVLKFVSRMLDTPAPAILVDKQRSRAVSQAAFNPDVIPARTNNQSVSSVDLVLRIDRLTLRANVGHDEVALGVEGEMIVPPRGPAVAQQSRHGSG